MKWEKVSSLISTSGLADTGSSVGINWAHGGNWWRRKPRLTSQPRKKICRTGNWKKIYIMPVLSSLLDGQHYKLQSYISQTLPIKIVQVLFSINRYARLTLSFSFV